ncbi:hypothetical protein BHM03_00031220 [Ensete ventricosum]|nr:hypothetical protein BHM03_00031220 [Ensete ventricosum]
MGKAEEGFDNDNRWFGVRHRGREPRVIEYPLVAIQSEGRQVPFPRGRKEARAPNAEGLWGNSALLPEVHPIHVDLRVLLRHRALLLVPKCCWTLRRGRGVNIA